MALAWVLALPAAVRAETVAEPGSGPAADQAIGAETLVGPTLKHALTSIYPAEESLHGDEGWVELGFMVDAKGKPFEVTVVRSSGNKVFERTAVRSIENTEFEPGRLNGRPVESSASIDFDFQMPELPTGASASFIQSYRLLRNALQARDRASADAELKQIKIKNLYEDAYYGLVLSDYAKLWGSADEQLSALHRAVRLKRYSRMLEREPYDAAVFEYMRLLLKMNHYGEAREFWKNRRKSVSSSKITTLLDPILAQVEKVRFDASAYDVEGSMPDGDWHLELLKHNFRFKVQEGHISTIKLRCEKGFIRFKFDPDLEYKVQSRYGDCSISLDGTAGTKFIMTQF